MKTLVYRDNSVLAPGAFALPSLGRARLVDGPLRLDAFTFILLEQSYLLRNEITLHEWVDPLIYRCVDARTKKGIWFALAPSPSLRWTRLQHLYMNCCTFVHPPGGRSSLATLRTITMRKSDDQMPADVHSHFVQHFFSTVLHQHQRWDHFPLSDPVLRLGVNDAVEGEALLAQLRSGAVGRISHDELELGLARVEIFLLGDEPQTAEPW